MRSLDLIQGCIVFILKGNKAFRICYKVIGKHTRKEKSFFYSLACPESGCPDALENAVEQILVMDGRRMRSPSNSEDQGHASSNYFLFGIMNISLFTRFFPSAYNIP